jgi:hypothetical protein
MLLYSDGAFTAHHIAYD